MLYTLALIIHVIICVALVLVILAQTSQGGLDSNLGGAAMNVFGGTGASKMLKKWTQILAIAFAVSCMLLAFLVRDVGSVDTGKTQKMQDKIDETQVPDTPVQEPAKPTGPIQIEL